MTKKSSRQFEVHAKVAASKSCQARPLIDIRSASERLVGFASGSTALSAAEVIRMVQGLSPTDVTGGYLMCAKGIRSLELVQHLHELGMHSFRSVAGGFSAWRDAGLPADYPEGLNSRQSERYARHLVMPQVGAHGQGRLLESRVLLVGLGGLNAPTALYLAAAGVGILGLVDDDTVERSNLQRQVIHSEESVGEAKTQSAADRIAELNPEVKTRIIRQRVTEHNAAELLAGWDLVLDGTDNFTARYALNAACVKLEIPLIYGSVVRFQGQVSVFWPAAPGAGPGFPPPCFQCFLPEAPSTDDAPSCEAAGVLGVLPGIVGTLQATEALKLLLGIGEPLVGKLLMFDALGMEFRQTKIKRREGCPCCSQA